MRNNFAVCVQLDRDKAMRLPVTISFAAALIMLAAPVLARDSLGVFGNWGAFRDDDGQRCFAIAMPQSRPDKSDFQPFASVGTWPDRGVRGQLHLRPSQRLAANARVTLTVGDKRFTLTGGGNNVWASNAAQDAAILSAMRAASVMSLRADDARGKSFVDRYRLNGAATAMDAATAGCVQR